ncbi:MAG: ABC transporter transmembrane domain-containing protein [Pseudomonadota bacterium]
MEVRSIEKTLFRFIWRHSKRDQVILLMVTSCLFPFLYLTLELPKRIINDAIGAQSEDMTVLGIDMSQISFLGLLCIAFLLSVLLHGLLKMRVNTMKGVLAERMLRRLRFGLIAQMLRFPKPYFQRTSQGEMVTMITTETDPMGGVMGDALAQPVLQAGQMLTILTFLFLQSFWFGLAAVALIPLQGWLIPKLQRQINLLNKKRIREVRLLAGVIGESAAGASDLRLHGGWRHRLAISTDRLSRLFDLRFEIYQKKFFMKFINNFITQLTPFFFFSVGGYLVIQGTVSLGALVAALAAYKDLSSPWKELLTYYNTVQDMMLRWDTLREKFSPDQGLDAGLMQNQSGEMPRLVGPITVEAATVADIDGVPVLQNISVSIAQGGMLAISAPSEVDRLAFGDLLTREVAPVAGRVCIGDQSLADLPQTIIAARIGHVNSKPKLFQGSFRDNVLMALMVRPVDGKSTAELDSKHGISADDPGAPWLDIHRAHLENEDDVRDWWLHLVRATGSEDTFLRRSLDQYIETGRHRRLAQGIVAIRPKVKQAIEEAGLARHLYRFQADQYNPALTVVENLFFAKAPQQRRHHNLMTDGALFGLFKDLGLADDLLSLSRDVVELLRGIFGSDGTSHPLFRNLDLDPETFEKATQILASQKQHAMSDLGDTEKALLIGFSVQVTADQVGAAFPQNVRDKIVALRASHADQLRAVLPDPYAPFDVHSFAAGLTVMENAFFSKVSDDAGARVDELQRIVSRVLIEAELEPQVLDLIFDLQLGLGGENLPAIFSETLALARATVKRPDILVLDMPLASFEAKARDGLPKKLRALLPQTTLVFLADRFENVAEFDTHLEIRNGRVHNTDETQLVEDEAVTADQTRKLRALQATDLFGGLDRKQLRLLAFGAKWYRAVENEVIFNKSDDPRDGAYLIVSGKADLFDLGPDNTEELVATVGPGTLVGELGLIRNEPRALSLRAHTELETLRLGAEEFLSVVENDAETAFKLLQVVASYSR